MYVCTQTRLNDVGWMPATFMVLGCQGLLRPQPYAPRTNFQPVADAQEPVVVVAVNSCSGSSSSSSGSRRSSSCSSNGRGQWAASSSSLGCANGSGSAPKLRTHARSARTDFRNPSSVKRLWRRPAPGQNGVSSARGFRTGPSPHRPNATALARLWGQEARGVSLASVWIDTHS